MTAAAKIARPAAPILPAICYPAHFLWVPPKLFLANLAAGYVLALLTGWSTGVFLRLEVLFLWAIPANVYCATLYRLDPFFLKVFLACMRQDTPRGPFWRTRNLIAAGRRVNRYN